MPEEIIITIPQKGIASGDAKLTAEAHGIKGEGCLEATKKLLKDSGKAESTKKTPEYYEKEQSASRLYS